VKFPPPRATVPTTCVINIPRPRINDIYRELLKLNVDDFPNACAVSLRVFVELGVDGYLSVRDRDLSGGDPRIVAGQEDP
jgi:hypothetical protein